MQIAIIGAPGSGKTTQSELLAEHLNVPVIAVGEMLRGLIGTDSPVSEEVESAFSKGELVPEELALGLLRQSLVEEDTKKGAIIDGMPRTFGEAREMQRMLSLRRVFHLQIGLQTALRRLIKRGREDDQPSIIERRFEVYQNEIKPILDFYRPLGILVEIDSSGASAQEINREIMSKL